ncbi:hypothetical protein [Ekhidna sp.]|uniref:hypothetical protein n=1 Tax=Ekhidna sp. TaxID=2608089 RepID=UPI003C7D75D9
MYAKRIVANICLLLVNFLLVAQQLDGLPTKSNIRKLDLKPGFSDISLKLSNGDAWPMKLSIPHKTIKEKVPLVVALHWGVSANENKDFMNCLMIPAIDTSRYMIIAPLSQFHSWWENPKEKQLVRLTSLVKEFWPVSQVIIAGYSDGGTGAVHFASNHPEQIDGAIAIAAYYRLASYKVPTYVIHGVRDQLFSYSRSKVILEKNKQKSQRMEFKTSETLSHYEACNYVNLLQKGLEWIEENLD